MSVLTQSYQCGTWFVCSILQELAVSNLGQPLFCLSITWSRCRNAYRDLWMMINVFSGMIWHSMMAAILFWRHIGIAAILELPPYWNCRHIGIWYHISHFCINAYAHVFSLTSLYSPFISDYRKYACSNNDIITISLSHCRYGIYLHCTCFG